MWSLQIDDFSACHAPEEEVRVSVVVLEKGTREESEATICGREYKTWKHQRESFGNSMEGTISIQARGGVTCTQHVPPDQPPLFACLKWFSLPL